MQKIAFFLFFSSIEAKPEMGRANGHGGVTMLSILLSSNSPIKSYETDWVARLSNGFFRDFLLVISIMLR